MRRRLGVPVRLRGPLPALPRPLDAACERWAGLPPRARVALAGVAVACAVGVSELRVSTAEARWGGPAVEVLVATEDLSVGDEPAVRSVTLPPSAVPPRAAGIVPEGAVLAFALPEGSVLTDTHLDPAGPAAGLHDDMRVVPFPVERGWGLAAGGWVDVWVLAGDGSGGVRVAQNRPVLDVSSNDAGRLTALIALPADEVEHATAGITQGRVMLAHAPPPSGG